MFRDVNRNVLFNVAADLGSSFLSDKATKTTDVDVLPLGQGVFHFLEHGFQRNQNINLRNTCFFRYLVNEVCRSPVD